MHVWDCSFWLTHVKWNLSGYKILWENFYFSSLYICICCWLLAFNAALENPRAYLNYCYYFLLLGYFCLFYPVVKLFCQDLSKYIFLLSDFVWLGWLCYLYTQIFISSFLFYIFRIFQSISFVLYNKVLLRYNSHTIKFSHLQRIVLWLLVNQTCVNTTTIKF